MDHDGWQSLNAVNLVQSFFELVNDNRAFAGNSATTYGPYLPT